MVQKAWGMLKLMDQEWVLRFEILIYSASSMEL